MPEGKRAAFGGAAASSLAEGAGGGGAAGRAGGVARSSLACDQAGAVAQRPARAPMNRIRRRFVGALTEMNFTIAFGDPRPEWMPRPEAVSPLCYHCDAARNGGALR